MSPSRKTRDLGTSTSSKIATASISSNRDESGKSTCERGFERTRLGLEATGGSVLGVLEPEQA